MLRERHLKLNKDGHYDTKNHRKVISEHKLIPGKPMVTKKNMVLNSSMGLVIV